MELKEFKELVHGTMEFRAMIQGGKIRPAGWPVEAWDKAKEVLKLLAKIMKQGYRYELS